MNLNNKLDFFRDYLNQGLKDYLASQTSINQRLREAIAYSLLDSGKRTRPILIFLAGETLGISLEQLLPAACAIEMIHTYSLIHDDLPAMDDDDYRRGKLTCHKAFDEATAILAGDALQAHAIQIITETSLLTPEQKVALIKTLVLASGEKGMVGGQALDLDCLNYTNITVEALNEIYCYKTGMLINACGQMALISGNLLEDGIKKSVYGYTQNIGLAFQIQDDVLEIDSTLETLGKDIGSDEARGKPTYPSLIGLPQAKALYLHLYAKAKEAISQLPCDTQPILAFTDMLASRLY